MELLCHRGLETNSCVWEGSDSKVICSQTSSGCRHLLCKSFERPQLEWPDSLRLVKWKWERACCGLLVLWWGYGGQVLIVALAAWLHEGSQFSKPQHHQPFVTPAHQPESSTDRCCLLQSCCSCSSAYLDNFHLSANTRTHRQTHTCSYSSERTQMTACTHRLCQLLQLGRPLTS